MTTHNKFWRSPFIAYWRNVGDTWIQWPFSGTVLLIMGTVILTAFIMVINHLIGTLSNPGLIYLLLVAMLAYHYGWRYSIIAAILELLCVYYFFITPYRTLKFLTITTTEQLITLAAVTGFVLAVVQLARRGRTQAEETASHLAALNKVGSALTSELDESRLLHLIAQTARDLTGAEFAAFTLRPINELGQPSVPSEGNLFYLAAVVGVTREQEELFRRMPLGGEGLLAPIFRSGVPVLVPDALALLHTTEEKYEQASHKPTEQAKEAARDAAASYAHGFTSKEGLHYLGVPRGHPIIRSFLGAPLLDRLGQVRGGLLLGHSQADMFTQSDETLLVGLAAQAAIALENARLYHEAQTQAQELDAIFESIADGVTLVNDQGEILRENRTARHLRRELSKKPGNPTATAQLLWEPAAHALQGNPDQGMPVTVETPQETRNYIVSSSPLRPADWSSGPLQASLRTQEETQAYEPITGAVVVWHDVTESHRLLIERKAHAQTAAQRALLQTVLNELPGSVYLVRGKDARLVLANQATKAVWGATWQPGQPMKEFLTTNGIRIFRTDGRSLPFAELATRRTIENGEPVRHHQEIIRHPDGTSIPVLVNAVPINSEILDWSSEEDGNTAKEPEPAALVVHQDVTALKEAERLKDDFIGIAAHELRNPLAVLKGFSHMLISQTARGNGPELADWQTEAIDAIDQATNRLVELTEDLLDVTRLQGGRLELHVAPTDLVSLVKRVVARLQITTEKHTLCFEPTDEYIIVSIDRQRIEQVLTNLINNAIKYSPDGGSVEILLSADQAQQQACLSIHDHGIGIPVEQQGRIFGRFVRADNAKARDINGTGLGLYLCRELVERHEGRIWFESFEGQGSTFYVALPLCDVTEP